ncbi:hypothetical protein TRIUR3_01567 [Triticum urartu]|uniref:Uncharacterized protein n=1 Tax=Triticum urartu TaxID=4572 RepID=M7ZWS2_TRIUA|nr:hypothetical protein TRIUR3_01567 [Triticum urartu]
MEFIQGSPTSMVVLLDLLPRKDLALHPDYIEKYYENTEADKQRKIIEELPQARTYLSPSLFVRSAFSPTAVFFTIDCGRGGESVLEEIVHGQLASVVKGVLQVWLDTCAGGTSEMEEGEREIMVRRDRTVRSKSIEVDLTANLPRMFGPDVSGRVIAEIRKAFGFWIATVQRFGKLSWSYAFLSTCRLICDCEKLNIILTHTEFHGRFNGLPPGQEELLERVVLEQSARVHEEIEERIRRELEYERLFLETGVTASQAHASKEADLRVMNAEQAKLYIDLDSSDSSESD